MREIIHLIFEYSMGFILFYILLIPVILLSIKIVKLRHKPYRFLNLFGIGSMIAAVFIIAVLILATKWGLKKEIPQFAGHYVFSFLMIYFYLIPIILFVPIIVKLIHRPYHLLTLFKIAVLLSAVTVIVFLILASLSRKYKGDNPYTPFDVNIWMDKMGIAED